MPIFVTVPVPVAQDVADFLGRGQDDTILALAEAHLPIVTAMVRAYTRGAGFDEVTGQPAPDVAAVIVSSCGRAVSNPSHTIEETTGPFSVRPGVFNGWSLPELAILHLYRKRAGA